MEASSWIVQLTALVAGVCVAWMAQSWMISRIPGRRSKSEEAVKRLAKASRLLATESEEGAREAAAEAEAAISLDPHHSSIAAEGHLLRAMALQRLGQHQAAIRSLDSALLMSQYLSPSQHSDAFLHRAFLFLSKSRHKSAISDLSHSLQIRPDHPHALCLLALCYERTHRFPEAEQAYQRAFAIDPKSDEAWAGLKRLRP